MLLGAMTSTRPAFQRIDNEKTLKEPLMQLNRDTYLYNKVNRFFFGFSLFTRAFWKLKLHLVLRPIASLCKKYINGHTVMVVYKKLE